MRYVSLPTSEPRRLSFYLAMEEFVARHLLPEGMPMAESDAFFMWQVEPSVIFGRNQVLENEVNVPYCREHGIRLYRRKSGGGCVYADMDNLMLSYVTSEDNVNFAFNRFVNMILLVLRRLGIEATDSSHNDVMIGDRKVCGTACYHLEGKSIVHSTMLYDTNMDHMLNAITPSHEKLQKKGIESVRQRITFLKNFTNLVGVEALKDFIRDTLCSGEYRLSEADVAAIEAIEETYLKEEFINLL
jgi:lipoic acid synthetase/lipoate-protein ligase A